MPVANPYFINIELVWPDGTPANQNQIARVKAFDQHGGVTTEQGQSGYNPGTGGWFPVYMQHISAFYPPRETPSLFFKVESTQEQVVHTTQVFPNIPSGSTVRITIGVGAVLVGGGGGGPTIFKVQGTITVEGNGPFVGGTVTAYDDTNESLHGLGSTTTASDGTYMITFPQTAFENNGGVSHTSPNLRIRVFSSGGTPLAMSALYSPAANPQTIDLEVPEEGTVEPPSGRRVFGEVTNDLGLPVSGITVRAYHVAWTVDGLQEIELGDAATTDSFGSYDIPYDVPIVAAPPHPCAPVTTGVNLIVYARKMEGTTQVTLDSSEVIYDAPAEQRVDLSVDEVSETTGSEYRRLDETVGHCLGETDEERYDNLNQLNERRDYLAFIAKSTGEDEALILAYVQAWLIAGEINAKVPASALSAPMHPEPMYALVRAGLGESLEQLLDVVPDLFFNAILAGISSGFVSSELEAQLPTLLEDWRIVLSRMLSSTSGETWQSELLDLVFPPADGTFPVVQLPVKEYSNPNNASSYVVPMPASVASGDLLLILLCSDYNATISTPADWTLLGTETTPGEIRLSVYAKVATGSEGGTTVTFTVAGNEPGCAQVMRVLEADWHGTLEDGVALGTMTKASGTNINIASLTAPWGPAKTLWIAVGGHEENIALVSIPPDFGNQLRTASGTATGNVTLVTARRQLETGAYGPGSFVIATGDNWISCLIAVRPAAAENPNKEAVVAAHFDAAGDLERMLDLLVERGMDPAVVEDLRFVLELYQAVDQYFPIVKVLYADKSSRGWDTIDDLSTVQLRSGSGGSGWEYYANAQQPNAYGNFPGDIPGRTTSEKVEIYAQRLFDKFSAAAPQTRYTEEAAASIDGTEPAGFADAVAFLQAHADFDLATTPIDKYLADLAEDGGGTLTDEAIEQLKLLQRLYRVYPDFEVTTKLLAVPFTSAVAIAQHDEHQFISDYEEALGGLTIARSVHRTAKHYAAEIYSTLVRFNQIVNDVGGSPMLPAAVNLTAAATQAQSAGQKYPNWVTLFGSLNSCASRHCQTVLSAGAYLVDLMAFVAGAPKNYLLQRRPDLAEIELTCANTDRVVPYIDLVNEILGAVIAPHVVALNDGTNDVPTEDLLAALTDPDELDAILSFLRDAGYVLTERATLKLSALDDPSDDDEREFVVEDDSWRFVIRRVTPTDDTYFAYGAPQTSETGRLLDVFPEHYNPGAVEKLEEAVFPFQLPLALGREETELVLDKRGVRHHQLLEAFQTVLDTTALLGDGQLARAYLRLTAEEENAILSSEKPVREYWGFYPDDDADDVTIPRPEDPSDFVVEPWFSAMRHMSVFMHRAQLRYEEVLALVDTRFVHDEGNSKIEVVAALGTDDPNKNILECNYNRFGLLNLFKESAPGGSEPFHALQKVSFFLRLRRKLGWDIVTTDRVLTSLFGTALPSDLILVSQFARLAAELKLAPQELTSFWAPLDTYRTDRTTRSVFDDVYLKGDPSSREYRVLDALARGGPDIEVVDELGMPPNPGDVQIDAFKTYLRGALSLTADDLDALWEQVLMGGTTTVTLAVLSEMHRITTFRSSLKLSVEDYYKAKALIGIEPFGDTGVERIIKTLSAVEELRRFASTKMDADELTYLLQDVSPPGTELGPDEAATDETYRQLAVRGGEIFARYPDVAAPDSATMVALLEEVMPIDKAGRATSILEEPGDLAVDGAFLERYFTVFWVPEEGKTIGEEIAETLDKDDPELRHADVYQHLRPYLVARAKRAAALQVAAERVNASADMVDKLLVSALTSVTGSTAPAIDDWIFGLGGWDDGSETLEGKDNSVTTRTTRWVVPADGEYRFVVRESSTSTAGATILLGGNELEEEAASPAVPAVPGDTVYGPETLKAGEVLELQIMYAGGNLFSLLVRRDNGDPAVLPAAQVSPFAVQAHVKLDKAVRLAQGLALTNAELDYTLFKDETLFDELPLDGGAAIPWDRIAWLIDQLQLNRRLRLDRTTLFELVREPVPAVGDDPVEDPARIATLTGWKEEDIEAIRDLYQPPPPASPIPPPPFRDIETWFVLDRCMYLTRKIDLRAAQIVDLLVTNAPTVPAALALRDSLRSSFSEDSWRDTFKPVRDRLRQRERDCLVGYLTSRDVELPSGESRFFIDANDLFSYFLIDVEMEPDTVLSRIVLALNSIQLFVQRVFLGLEPEKALRQLEQKQEQWKWMSAYRVWEANRKVFLFPENWVEPELRDDKTELFRVLEEDLLQDEVTAERGELMLARYVEGLDEISDLVVVGACTEGVFHAGTSNVVHIVARTRSAPYVYYHRSFRGKQFDDGSFTPWRKVPLEIEAKSVAPVIVGGGLRLFWPIVTLKEKVTEDTGDEKKLESKAEIRLAWSTLVPNLGEWSKPRLGTARVFDYEPVTVFHRDEKDDGPDTSYYHFRTGTEDKGTVRIEVHKTQFPTSTNQYLSPTLLGIVRVTAAGEDFAEPVSRLQSVGNNHPNGSYLLYNAAIGAVGRAIEGKGSGTTFTMRGSAPFFAKHTPPFRAVVTNFGYLEEAQNEPFFFETPTVHLFALHRGTSRSVGLSADLSQEASFITFNHPQIAEVKNRHNANGPVGIMNRLTQALPVSDGRYYYNYSNSYVSATKGGYHSGYNNRYNGYYGGIYLGYHIAGDRMAWGITQRDFEAEFEPGVNTVERPYPLPTVEFGYGTPFGIYNWELFFHLPLLVADRLSTDMRFEEAMHWYHYVFDPRLDLNSYEKGRRFPYDLPDGARYWNFLPFFANKDATDSLLDVFGVTQALSKYERADLTAIIAEWRQNPFNPHLIARQRIAAYQKSVVMKYLENLIAWGDQLFRRDSFESINLATQLYVLAAEILGKRPEVIEPLVKEPRYTYRELAAQGIDPFSNALVQVENLMVANSPYVDGKELDSPPPGADSPQSTAIASLYFRIPRNEKLDGYWDTVSDRLFKIRNSMNIDGVKRTLALFQPPIDPALLVKATALNVDLSSALAQLNQPRPHYRFNVWSSKAQDLANELKSYGGSLLSALEKKDGEELAQLRQSHELRMLGLVKKVRQEQLDEAEAQIVALDASIAMTQNRLQNYTSREFISATEAGSLSKTNDASILDLVAGVHSTIAGVLGAIPQTSAGAFGAQVEFGGSHLNSIFTAVATGISTAAGIIRSEAGMMGTVAGYERRQEDWDLQIDQAKLELEQLDKQKVAAEIRRDIAQKELDNHDVQIEQSEEVSAFLQDKFTNQELYQWMTTELMRTYRRAFNLAYDVAKIAERTFQFELGINDTSYIGSEYFDSGRQGLLAGEQLAYDIKRMDIAYLQKDRREFEITKAVSLAALNPLALQLLRDTGTCSFALPESIFDLDHPGQYFRRIQAVRLTIPCVTGPYTSVSAKLSLLGSAIRVSSAVDPMDPEDYPYRDVNDPRFVHDIGGIQSIATSTSQDDAGLFELNFRDERYLPFEGSGAISRWRLDLPQHAHQFDYQTISDVIVNVSYTARDGGGSLTKGASDALVSELNRLLDGLKESPQGIGRVFSMKREFPDALHQLLTTGTTTMAILPQHFPFLFRDKEYDLMPFVGSGSGHLDMVVLPKTGKTAEGRVTFALDDVVVGAPFDVAESTALVPRDNSTKIVEDWEPETWTFTQVESTGSTPLPPESLTLTPTNVDDVVFQLKYTVAE